LSDPFVTLSSASFLDGLGVNTHIPYTDGEYGSVSLIISDLQYLGIDELRDGISDGTLGSAPLWHYIEIAEAGEKFTFLIDTGAESNADIEAELVEITAVEKAVPGSVIAIEGVNEINNWPVTFNGTSGLQGALDLQAALYADVKADSALAGVAVDYFTGYGAGTVGTGPDLSTTAGLADYDTQHPYPNGNEAPAYWVSRAAALGNASSASTPAVYTETGYSTDNVSPYVQEVYTLDLLMDTAQQGIAHTDLYDLLDAYAPGSPQGDDGYGLFDDTGAPKPAAIGIHDLTTILQQTITGGADMPAGGLSYSVSNLPAGGNSMLLVKPDGADVIVLWAEPQLWDNATDTQLTPPTETVTISLDADYATLSLYDPVLGTTAIETFTDASHVTLSLTDHPILLEISGGDPAPDGNALCFVTGTYIRGLKGEAKVEDIAIGDVVVTPAGPRAVEWIGRRSYAAAAIAGNPLMIPVCIRRDALAEGVPGRDLWVSPGHGIWIDNILIPAWRLTNGVSIIQPERAAQVDYIHLELAEHALLFAENCLAESYYDEGARQMFQNAASYRLPRRPSAPPLPRLEDGFHLQHIQRRLQARAGLACLPEPATQKLRGFVDVAGPEIVAGWAQCEGAPDFPVRLDVLLDGTYLTSLLANRYRADLRTAGLGSGIHGFELRLPRAGRIEVRRAADQVVLPLTEAALAAAA
jgi:Hint domain